jgi:hypothetical protein
MDPNLAFAAQNYLPGIADRVAGWFGGKDSTIGRQITRGAADLARQAGVATGAPKGGKQPIAQPPATHPPATMNTLVAANMNTLFGVGAAIAGALIVLNLVKRSRPGEMFGQRAAPEWAPDPRWYPPRAPRRAPQRRRRRRR